MLLNNNIFFRAGLEIKMTPSHNYLPVFLTQTYISLFTLEKLKEAYGSKSELTPNLT